MTPTIRPAPERKIPLPEGASPLPCVGCEAESRLRRSGYLALRDVSCEAHAATVQLHGHLPTYYLKQLAQEVVAAVEGVRQVINRIEVVISTGRPLAERQRSVEVDESIQIAQKPHLWEGPSLSEHPEGSHESCWS
jgi:hypothetical protein